MTDSLRIKISFFISCLFHFFLIVGIKFVPKNRPIVITFPVELINLPSVDKKVDEKIFKEEVKKEKITISNKKVKKDKKKEVEKIENLQKEETKITSQTQTLPSLSLETAKFPFTYYVNQIRKKIVENWLWSKNYPGELKTVVYFKILRSGEIEGLTLKESSKNKFYDNICLRAVEVSAPFPPLPEGFKEDYLGVYFEFRYRE